MKENNYGTIPAAFTIRPACKPDIKSAVRFQVHQNPRVGNVKRPGLMPHLGRAGVVARRHERDSQNLSAMSTGHPQRIRIRILNVLLSDPKEFLTFRTFSDKHRHNSFLFSELKRPHKQ